MPTVSHKLIFFFHLFFFLSLSLVIYCLLGVGTFQGTNIVERHLQITIVGSPCFGTSHFVIAQTTLRYWSTITSILLLKVISLITWKTTFSSQTSIVTLDGFILHCSISAENTPEFLSFSQYDTYSVQYTVFLRQAKG